MFVYRVPSSSRSLQVIDGFRVMWTRSPEDTVDWLASLTDRLRSRSTVRIRISSALFSFLPIAIDFVMAADAQS